MTQYPWQRIMDAALRIERGEEYGRENYRLAIGWFLRREAGRAAASYTRLTGDGVPAAEAQAVISSDGGFVIADSLAAEVC